MGKFTHVTTKSRTNMLQEVTQAPDELEVFLLSEAQNPETNEISRVFRVFINDGIEHPAYYNQVFMTLLTATERDTIQFSFNSGGGDAATAIEMVSYIRTSSAHIEGHIVGECHSATSIIAMACDEQIIHPHASMLIHTYSGGLVGKRSDMESQIKHEYKHFKDFFDDVYEGFLNPKELKAIWEGKDLWLNAAQIVDRFNKRDAYFAALDSTAKDKNDGN
jgi:ATP-dependent protease ClpP protease subunit